MSRFVFSNNNISCQVVTLCFKSQFVKIAGEHTLRFFILDLNTFDFTVVINLFSGKFVRINAEVHGQPLSHDVSSTELINIKF